MTEPQLTKEQEQALDAQHGFVQGSSYVLMTKSAYREMMGVGTDEELAESLKAIAEGLADVAAGRTTPMDQVFRELHAKYGVPR
jgi:hypothetical protein